MSQSGSSFGHNPKVRRFESCSRNQIQIGSSNISRNTLPKSKLYQSLYLRGMSSLEPRSAHNPKVVGSNPAPRNHFKETVGSLLNPISAPHI